MVDNIEDLDKAKKKQSPALLADKLLETRHFVTDRTGTTFEWNRASWGELSLQTLKQVALEADGFRRSSVTRRNEIIEQIKARSHVADLAWGRVADHEIAFLNGVLDIKSGKLRDHRPEDYLERVLPWKWEAQARCPTWLRVLDDWFGDVGDESGISAGGEREALQECFGYCCMSHAKYKAAPFLFGKSDTGKSLAANLMTHLVGHDRVCTLPLEKMGDAEALAVIVGKALNLVTEIDSHALVADGGFKTLISMEEPIEINAKYKPRFTYWPTAKHVFLSNNLPRVTDRSEGVIGRFIIIPFTRVFAASEQDDTLKDTLRTEMPGIIAWAVEGAKRLIVRRGKFTKPAAGVTLIDELRRQANPAIDFKQECLVVDVSNAIPLTRLVDRFNAWHKGGKRVTTRGLGAMLRQAGEVVKEARYGKAVHTSLFGYRLLDQDVPALLDVGADALTSTAKIVDAANEPKAADGLPE